MAIIHSFHFSDGNSKLGKHVGNFSVMEKSPVRLMFRAGRIAT